MQTHVIRGLYLFLLRIVFIPRWNVIKFRVPLIVPSRQGLNGCKHSHLGYGNTESYNLWVCLTFILEYSGVSDPKSKLKQLCLHGLIGVGVGGETVYSFFHTEEVALMLSTQIWFCCSIIGSLESLEEALSLNAQRGQWVFRKQKRPKFERMLGK